MNDDSKESNLDLNNNVEALLDKIKILEENVKNNWELFLIAKADMENLKKKTDKEIQNTIKYSNKKILFDLLPLIDSFEACLNDEYRNDDGIKLLFKIFLNLLEKYGVKKIDVNSNENFDPLKHEVVSVVYNDSFDNVIASVLQSGYIMYDHILRYAKVSVFKKNIKD